MNVLKWVAISWLLFPISNGETLDKEMDQAILKLTSGLAPDSLKLPELSIVSVPPAAVEAAGKDFIHAWQIWKQVMTETPQDAMGTGPVPKDKVINAAEDWKSFSNLLHRCIVDDPPPDISEFSRFNYNDHSFCGDGFMSFDHSRNKGINLLLVRRGRYLDALRRSVSRAEGVDEFLLRAFGVDTEEFRIGVWLNEGWNSPTLCGSGGELTARMVMDWIDQRWEIELDRYKKTVAARTYVEFHEPHFPSYEIVRLLRPDNGVTNETKSRIAGFINSRGLEIVTAEKWIQNCPKGAEKWLIDIAKRGLTDDLNSVRQRSADFLDRAGVPYPKPEMKAGPRFRVTVDGEPWPGRSRSQSLTAENNRLNLHSEGGGEWSAKLTLGPDGIYTSNPDDFNEKNGMGRLTRVEISQYPTGYDSKPIDLASPWLFASASLPLSFTEVNQITMETTCFTIQPMFAGLVPPAANDNYEVEFGSAIGEKDKTVPRGGLACFQVKGSQPLVLPNVSLGDYWIRIDCPGAVAGPFRKITVSSSLGSYSPVLERGSSIVVPVEWKELGDPEHLPFELAVHFPRLNDDLNDFLRSMLVLKRTDGTVIEQFGKLKMADGSLSPTFNQGPAAARGRYRNAAVFFCVPPGEYVVESPDRGMKSENGYPSGVITKSSVNVILRSDSPHFVTTEPLKISYEANGQ